MDFNLYLQIAVGSLMVSAVVIEVTRFLAKRSGGSHLLSLFWINAAAALVFLLSLAALVAPLLWGLVRVVYRLTLGAI